MKQFKTYEVIPRTWSEEDQDYISDIDGYTPCDTYKEAVSCAKEISNSGDTTGYTRADIRLYQSYDAEKWVCDHEGCFKWTEAYSFGRQIPCTHINGTPIWRWDGDKDLKPRIK